MTERSSDTLNNLPKPVSELSVPEIDAEREIFFKASLQGPDGLTPPAQLRSQELWRELATRALAGDAAAAQSIRQTMPGISTERLRHIAEGTLEEDPEDG